MNFIVGSAALAVALAGAVTDVLYRRIPNRLTYAGILIGIALRSVLFGWHGLASALAGGAIAGGLFFLLYLVRGMGAGDVKLIAAIGCITGPVEVLKIMIACGIAGGVLAIAVMVYSRRIGSTLRNVGELLHFLVFWRGNKVHPTLNIDNPQSVRLPYGVAIACGALYAFIAVMIAR